MIRVLSVAVDHEDLARSQVLTASTAMGKRASPTDLGGVHDDPASRQATDDVGFSSARPSALAASSSLVCDAQFRGRLAAEQGDQLAQEGVEFAADRGDLGLS